jgi:uncharacterized protein
MDTQQSAIKTAREFINSIVASGFPLKKAILFGSFASNRQHEYSDIDLALIADEFSGVGYFDLKYFINIKISQTKFTPIETHTFNTEYFLAGDPFVQEIVRTGLVLM